MSVKPETSPGAEPRIRIGELSRRTGVGVDTLRAWERRYGVLEPVRSEGGYRLYGPDDVARVRRVSELIDSGLSASQAADAARVPTVRPSGAVDEGEPGRLVDALVSLDEAASEEILDHVFAALSVEAACRLVVLPALRELGDRWERGEVTVGEEHFASNLIRARLMSLSRGWGTGGSRHAVLACPPGELHDLGLVVFGLVLRGRGWRVTYLGPDTPTRTIAEAADKVRPDAIVISALEPERVAAEATELEELGAAHRVLLAGAEPVAELARRLNVGSLAEGPIEGAVELAGA